MEIVEDARILANDQRELLLGIIHKHLRVKGLVDWTSTIKIVGIDLKSIQFLISQVDTTLRIRLTTSPKILEALNFQGLYNIGTTCRLIALKYGQAVDGLDSVLLWLPFPIVYWNFLEPAHDKNSRRFEQPLV